MQPLVCFLVVCPGDGDVAQLALVLHFFAIPVYRRARYLQDQCSAEKFVMQYIVELITAAGHHVCMSSGADTKGAESVARQVTTTR